MELRRLALIRRSYQLLEQVPLPVAAAPPPTQLRVAAASPPVLTTKPLQLLLLLQVPLTTAAVALTDTATAMRKCCLSTQQTLACVAPSAKFSRNGSTSTLPLRGSSCLPLGAGVYTNMETRLTFLWCQPPPGDDLLESSLRNTQILGSMRY